jgi:hypothetical protein
MRLGGIVWRAISRDGNRMTRSELSAAAIATYDGAGGASLAADISGLVAGTQVATPGGAVPVETLRPGDMVLTRAGPPARVTRIARRAMAAETLAQVPVARAVRLRANALGHLLPRRTLLLAPGQMVMVRDVAAPAAALVNGISIRRSAAAAGLVYIGVRLDTPLAIRGAILAEGLACATTLLCCDSDAVLTLRAGLAELAGLLPGPLEGNIARLDRGGAEGWVMDKSHPDLPVALEIVVDGEVVARTLADRRRPDLEMAGLGNCGFTVQLKRTLTAERDYVVRLRRIDDGADVPGSPLLLPAARGDVIAFDAGLRRQIAAARGEAARDALAGFLAEQIDFLVQSRVERPAPSGPRDAS